MRHFAFLLKPVDATFNLFVRLKKRKIEKKKQYELIDRLTAADNAFITSLDQNNIFKRRKAEMDWLQDYPWVIASSEPNSLADRFYFSTQYPIYENLFLRIKNAGKTVAIVFLKNKEQHIALQYIWSTDDALEQVAKSILHVISGKQPKTLSLYHRGLIEKFDQLQAGYLFQRATSQFFMVYAGLPDLEDHLKDGFQHGDGDTMFT